MAAFVHGADAMCGMPKLILETAPGESAPQPCCCNGYCNCLGPCCDPVLPPLPEPCSNPLYRSVVRISNVLIIYNPIGGISGSRARFAAVCRLEAALRSLGISVRVCATEFMGHATSVANSLRFVAPKAVAAGSRAFSAAESRIAVTAWKRADVSPRDDLMVEPLPTDEVEGESYPPFDCVIAGGGDGTLREVVSGLEARPDDAASTIPVVGLPIGTGNSTMRDARIVKPVDTLRAVLGGQMHRVDAFEVLHAGALPLPDSSVVTTPAALSSPVGGAAASVAASSEESAADDDDIVPVTPFDDSRPKHGVVIDAAALTKDSGAITLPGRLIGVNVISVLASTDATLFAERNRWLGGLRYDAGGVAALLALHHYRLSMHVSGHSLPASFPLSEPDSFREAGTDEHGDDDDDDDGAAVAASRDDDEEDDEEGADTVDVDAMITLETSDEPVDGLPRRRSAGAAAEAVGDASPGAGELATAARASSSGAAGVIGRAGTPVSNPGLFALFVQNSRTSGKALEVAPASKLDDGLLDIMFMRRLTRLSLFRGFNLLRSGAHCTLPDLDLLQCQSILMSHNDAYVPGLKSRMEEAEHGRTAAKTGEPGHTDHTAPRLIIIVDGDVKVLTPVLVRSLPRAWATMVIDPVKTPALA